MKVFNKIKKSKAIGVSLIVSCVTAIGVYSLYFQREYPIVNPEYGGLVEKTIEKEIINENWDKVVSQLASVTSSTPSPILRMIKGQSCLALNRNNESTELFLTVFSDKDREDWRKWTDYIVSKNPKSTIAYYYQGDALARVRQWDQAMTAFNKALDLHSGHALSLNGRGVIYAEKNIWDKAVKNFEDALKANQSFADAYANRGFLNIQKKDGAKGAVEWFNKALTINPDFTLALLGRGCIQLVLNHLDEAQIDLKSAQKDESGVSGLVLESLINIDAYIKGMTKKEYLVLLSGKKPGTTFGKQFDDAATAFKNWTQNPNKQFGPGGYNDVHNKLNKLPDNMQKDFFDKVMAPAFDRNPDLAKKGYSRQAEINNWNKGLGGVMGNMVDKGSNYASSLLAKGDLRSKAIGGVVAIGGGGIKGGLDGWTSNTLDLNKTMQSGYADYGKNKKLNLPAGGVDMSFVNANWDDGKWPFIAYYGLLYRATPEEGSI